MSSDIKVMYFTCSSLLFFSSSILSLVRGSPWMSSSDWSWAFSIALILWPSSFSFPSVSSTMHSRGWHKWKGGRGSASGPRPTEVGTLGWRAACLCLDTAGFEQKRKSYNKWYNLHGKTFTTRVYWSECLPLLETGGGVVMFDGARSGSWGGTTIARAWNGTRGTWQTI